MNFSKTEMLCKYEKRELPEDVYKNLMGLRERLNKLGKDFLPPRILACGYRNPAHNAQVGGARKSNHLTGRAVDIVDRDNQLKSFLKSHEHLLAECGLYAEDYEHTPTWVHLQSNPPASGKRVFLP